jgi:hypothetical protein
MRSPRWMSGVGPIAGPTPTPTGKAVANELSAHGGKTWVTARAALSHRTSTRQRC